MANVHTDVLFRKHFRDQPGQALIIFNNQDQHILTLLTFFTFIVGQFYFTKIGISLEKYTFFFRKPQGY
jgi:hypothetical protein